jgi:hypothetical protein
MPRITLRGAIVADIMSKKVVDFKKILFSSNSVRLLMGSSKEDKKISVDDFVSFFDSFQCVSTIKDYVTEDGPLRRPQRSRLAKRSGECDHDAVQVAVKGRILKFCAMAPSKLPLQ